MTDAGRSWTADPGTLGSLIERLESAYDSLTDLMVDGSSTSNRTAHLMSKREGVLLALSYAREESRIAASDDASSPPEPRP